MTGSTMTDELLLTVGQVAEEVGVTVRTLHHYDDIGLVHASARSWAGYRLYTADDLQRLQHVVVYRRLGFSLEEIAGLLAEDSDVAAHLRRQRNSVTARIDELHRLVGLIDRALEDEMTQDQERTPLSGAEMKEIFGDTFDDGYAAEAEQRWGGTGAWQQSAERTAGYDRGDWQAVKTEADDLNARFVALLRDDVPAGDVRAMDVAEAHRQHICTRFYDCSRPMHAQVAELYVTDPRFRQGYEDVHPGLAQYVRDAVVANAARG